MTMWWNSRLLPHPLLAPWTNDYGEAEFLAAVPHAVRTNGDKINLTIKYHLTSQTLRELVANEQAQYVGLVVCLKTFSRGSYPSRSDETLQSLEAGDYSEALTFTPYVVATSQLEGFISEEHAEEIRQIKAEGFTIPPGSILAVGRPIDIMLEDGGNPFSVMDLVADKDVASGSFQVELGENKIEIHVSPDDKARMDALRNRGEHTAEMASLFPGVYLHALTEALLNLSDYSEQHWSHNLRSALQQLNIDPDADPERLKTDALKHAQTLLGNPLGTLLTAFENREEE